MVQGVGRFVRALIPALCLAGCARSEVAVEFKPYSAVRTNRAPIVGRALVSYEGDVEILADAGGKIIGSLEVDGNGFADSEDVRLRAREEAASLGGTHLVVANEGSTTSWARLTPDRATTTVSGNTATTTFTPGAQLPIVRPHGSFVVVRVSPENWLKLPIGLRPEPGRDFVGDYPDRDETEHTTRTERTTYVSAPAVRRADSGWFCASTEDGREGTCARTAAECQAGSQWFAPADQSTSTCVASSAATCVSSYGTADGPHTSCHPTIQSCRAQRQRAIDGGAKIGRECALSR